MHIDQVRAVLRKRLRREPTYDDIAEATAGTGLIELRKEFENLKEKEVKKRARRP